MAVPDLRVRQKQQELSGCRTGLTLSLSVCAGSNTGLELSPVSGLRVILGDLLPSASLSSILGQGHVMTTRYNSQVSCI